MDQVWWRWNLNLGFGEREDFCELVFSARKIVRNGGDVEPELSFLQRRHWFRQLDFSLRDSRRHQSLLGGTPRRVRNARPLVRLSTFFRRIFFLEFVRRIIFGLFFAIRFDLLGFWNFFRRRRFFGRRLFGGRRTTSRFRRRFSFRRFEVGVVGLLSSAEFSVYVVGRVPLGRRRRRCFLSRPCSSGVNVYYNFCLLCHRHWDSHPGHLI